MTMQEYQGLAMRTSPEGHDRRLNGCLGLIGETGEIVDALKKWLFQSGEGAPFPTDRIIDECGDTLWYCAELAEGMGITLAEIQEKAVAIFARDVRRENAKASAVTCAVRLSWEASLPYADLFDAESPDDEGLTAWQHEQAIAEIASVLARIEELLERFCGTGLETAMRRNIGKLRQRYPDGFDPERSMHRTENA